MSFVIVVVVFVVFGGIECMIVEVVLELFESWKGNFVFVNWKMIVVEVD